MFNPQIGIGATRVLSGSAASLGTTMATTHYNRVIADGGVVPAGISGLSSILDSVIAAYGVTDSADFNTKVPVFLDPQYTGYKLGAGAGTTAGQAARTVYAISSSADVTQTTAASQPLLLDWSGVNYWWGSGVAGNYVSTPNAAANQITGDIEIIAKIDFVSNGSYQWITSKGNGGVPYNCDFGINDRTPFFQFNSASYSATASIGTSFNGYVKVNRDYLTGNINYYTSLNGISYTILGSVVSSIPGVILTNNLPLYVGRYSNPSVQFTFQGKIYRVTLSDSIGGAPVVDFNPQSYSASTSQTDWNSSTGEVWTINTDSAASGFVGRLVNRTIMAFGGDASTTNLSPNVSIQVNQPDTVYAAFKFDVFNNYQAIYDSNTTTTRQYLTNTNTSSAFEIGTNLSFVLSGLSQNTLKLATALFNGASSSLQANNGTVTTGNAGTQKMDGLRIGVLSNGPPGYTLKGIVNTILVSAANDGTATKTALYNVIKSMNNNAF